MSKILFFSNVAPQGSAWGHRTLGFVGCIDNTADTVIDVQAQLVQLASAHPDVLMDAGAGHCDALPDDPDAFIKYLHAHHHGYMEQAFVGNPCAVLWYEPTNNDIPSLYPPMWVAVPVSS